jgi:hypothetical protein
LGQIEPGSKRDEMELGTMETEVTAKARGARRGLSSDRGHCPLENPAIDPIPGDPICEPHPAEPGVKSDGSAAPLENPGDPFD